MRWLSKRLQPARYVESDCKDANLADSVQTTASYAVPTATCPDNDGQKVTDGLGYQYWIKCTSDTSGGGQGASGANVYSFNDCFYRCSNNLGLTAPTTCSGFTYIGGANGVGGGTCYLKVDNSVVFNPSTNTGAIGAIRIERYGAYTTTSGVGPLPWPPHSNFK